MLSSQVSEMKIISETLARELLLTEDEISLLKSTDQNKFSFLRSHFIFDGYDEIEDIDALHSLASKEELLKHNFFELNKSHKES